MSAIRSREAVLLRRIRGWTWFFIFGLFVSGVTAIPLTTELNWLCEWVGTPGAEAGVLVQWLERVRVALERTQSEFPFLFYGTDWLAFGHIVIAVAFIGALRDPVRNRWLFDFGLFACAMVIPWAFVFGSVRGIPVWWQLIDCSFGIIGAIPLWCCRKWTLELETRQQAD